VEGIELLWTIFELLPIVFAVDLLAFHFTDDHPLAIRWWWRRKGHARLTSRLDAEPSRR
jgi:hypothetical protein